MNTYYNYLYTYKQKVVYVGCSKDPNRAKNFLAHKHCIPTDVEYSDIGVLITSTNLSLLEAVFNESVLIKHFGIENLWNSMAMNEIWSYSKYGLIELLNKTSDRIVPKSLTQSICQHVQIKGDVLMASDMNACMLQNMYVGYTDSITVCDDDEESRSVLSIIDNISVHNQSFLTTRFKCKYDLIMMNPPWVKDGIKFVNKAVDLLNPGGKLVCIISNNQFTLGDNSKIKPGNFHNLLKRGSFERIECFKGCPDYGARSGEFKGRGDWLWFVFSKSDEFKKNTTIVNRLGQSFKYELKGDEGYIPQLPDEETYFDWSGGDRFVSGTVNTTKTSDFAMIAANNIIGLQIKTIKANSIIDRECALLPITNSTSGLINFEARFKNNVGELVALYGVSQGSNRLRMPPLRK